MRDYESAFSLISSFFTVLVVLKVVAEYHTRLTSFWRVACILVVLLSISDFTLDLETIASNGQSDWWPQITSALMVIRLCGWKILAIGLAEVWVVRHSKLT